MSDPKIPNVVESSSTGEPVHTLKRHLRARHIRLMALGSTIGVGLFLGAGSAIAHAGPAILLGYLLAGIVAFVVLRASRERPMQCSAC